MQIRNFEFKVRVDNIETHESKLLSLKPDFRGTDHQIDTYFNVPKGRLKLREGNIENALIYYERSDEAASRLSEVTLFRFSPDPALKSILQAQFGIKTVVDKIRKIYFVGHVKFHFDHVGGLGQFAEVEAIDTENRFSEEELKKQCDHYFGFLGFKKDMLMTGSYSDMVEDVTDATSEMAD